MKNRTRTNLTIVLPVTFAMIVTIMLLYFVLTAGLGDARQGVTEISTASSGTLEGEPGDGLAEGTTPVAAAVAEENIECSFQEWIGKPVDEDAVRALHRPYRILGPDSMATMDFSPVRINLEVDEEGIVTAIRCG